MSQLIEDSSKFVFEKLKKELPDNFIYHNFTHTQRVVKSLHELMENMPELTDEDKEICCFRLGFTIPAI